MAPSAATPSLAHIVPASSSASRLSSRRLLTPSTNPIPLLPAPAALYVALAHSLLVPLYYYLRSSSLIKEPLDTLIWDLGPLALMQAVGCVFCIPVSGGWNGEVRDVGKGVELSAAASGRSGKAAGVGRKKGASGKGAVGGGEGGWWGVVTPTIFSLILTFALPTVPLTLLALCLGAPLFPYSQIPHTILLATHVSLLAFLPIFYTHGVSGPAWRDVAAAWLPFDEAGVWAGTVGCFVGGWVGAIPIALDWDREWQKWPCTVVWGVVMGWMAGRVLTGKIGPGLGLGLGRRIDLSEWEEIPGDVSMVEKEREKKKS